MNMYVILVSQAYCVFFVCRVDSHDFTMKECAAYGPVSSTRAHVSSPQVEGTYESV